MRHLIALVEAAAVPEEDPEVSIVDDDGDVPHAKAAFFDDDAYVRYWKTQSGMIVIQTMRSSADMRGRDMLKWLAGRYGLPIVVVEATPEAMGFWRKMRREKLIVKVSPATGWPSPLEAQSVAF